MCVYYLWTPSVYMYANMYVQETIPDIINGSEYGIVVLLFLYSM